MPRPRSIKPAYCLHRSSGRAFVKIDGHRTYLGKHNTQESRDAYDLAIGAWIARGRTPARLPAASTAADGTVDGPKPLLVLELADAYWSHVQAYYVDHEGKCTAEVLCNKHALAHINRLYGRTPAAAFGPNSLRVVREAMIAAGWSRRYSNKQTGRLRAMFKWGAAHEIIPGRIYQDLASLEPLKRGRTNARETDPVRPVAQAHVDATLPLLSPTLQSLVKLQLLTGARGGELLIMRTGDIDRAGDVWTYRPSRHKTQHHDHDRLIRIGPKGREILQPLLKMDPIAFIFPSGEPGGRYSKDSYGRAIARACDAAFPPPDELARTRVPAKGRKTRSTRWETETELRKRLGEKWKELKAWRKAHQWHPHQLRHSAATYIASTEGIEMARIILGHRHLKTTEIYAEADQKKAEQTMLKIG